MPLQNRVLPTGEVVATRARGTLTGNRGILHREDRTLGTSRWTHKAWICCTLGWKGIRRSVMTGRTWTELFFLDEATAFAAGHRPCALCRRAEYDRFRLAWAQAHKSAARAPDIDAVLHAARIVPGTRNQQRWRAPLATLPPGTFVLLEHTPHLVGPDRLHTYSPDGYRPATCKAKGAEVIVLTPAPLVAVLQAGYTPALHETVLL